jgi:Cu/Ag efflux pump CusA
VNTTEVIVSFDPASGRSREETIADIRSRLAAEFPGAASEVEQPLAHLLTHLLSGVNAQVAIKVFGPDLDRLREVANEVREAVQSIPGVVDLYVEPQVLVRQVEVVPRRADLAARGVPVERVARTVELGLEGAEVSRLSVGSVAYPIVLRLAERDRGDLPALRDLPIEAAGGGTIRLSEVADVGTTWTPNDVNRESASRRVVVQHNVQGRALGDVVRDVERALEPIRRELAATPGYTIRLSGQFEAQQEASRRLVWLSAFAFAAMFFILFAHYRSFNLALQVMASIPMAMIGAVAYVVATRQTVSIAVLVGLISLAGIAARNGILLIDHYLHVLREQGLPFGVPMILLAGKERLIPVLMTALCTGIALVPIALSPDKPGRELLFPVATVIVGGLLSSTLLDILVRPGLFLVFGRRAAMAHVAHRERRDRVAEELAEELAGHGGAPASAPAPVLASTASSSPGGSHAST